MPPKENPDPVSYTHLDVYKRQTIDKPVISTREVIDARKVVQEVYIDEKIGRYIVDIVFATRFPDQYGLPNLKERCV